MLLGLVLASCAHDKTRRLGDITIADHGTTTVAGAEAAIKAGSFYFSPSFLRGEPGQRITLHVRNVSSIEHNFTIEEQGLAADIEAKQTVELNITFPSTGAVLFVCVLHRFNGMAGELLAGDATPQAPSH
jgi:plastocyanin